VSRLRGNLQASRITCGQAKAAAEAAGDKDAQGYALFSLGEVLQDEGDLAGARQAFEGSLALRNESGEIQAAGESRVALARLSIEEDHAADAEADLRKCKDQFRRERQADDELTAAAVLIRDLQAQDKIAGARGEAAQARPLATRNQNTLVLLQFDLAAARLPSDADDANSSREALRGVLKQAHDHGFVGIELETRFALAGLGRRAGQAAPAKADLASLATAARGHGYGLMARRAADALR
jgi:MalT-like TPR region